MSDQRVRELERRWRETGAVVDRAAWLRERLRAGELEPARVELAAWVGDEAAQALVPEASTPGSLEDLSRGLARWGEEPGRDVAVRLYRPSWKSQVHPRALLALAARLPCQSSGAARAREITLAWLARPGVETAREVERMEWALDPRSQELTELLPRLALLHCRGIHPDSFQTALLLQRVLGGGPAEAMRLIEAWGAATIGVRMAAAVLGEAVARAALRDDLAAWALAERDPLLPEEPGA